MDAGVAAVLGALAGAVATTGAALATGWSMREQARITARSEYVRQRMEPREAAYRDLIGAGVALREQGHFVGDFRFPDAPMEFLLDVGVRGTEKAMSLSDVMAGKWMSPALLGPPAVSKAAEQLGEANEKLSYTLYALSIPFGEGVYPTEQQWGEFDTAWHALSEYLKQFIAEAQRALDEDGTRPPGRRPFKQTASLH